MADRILLLLTGFVLLAAASDATAMELDRLLPTDLPGYGAPDIITIPDRPHPDYAPEGVDLGGIALDPKIDAGAGYDSSPNGAGAGSAVLELDPDITALDPILGFGAYAAGSFTAYPQDAGQNLSGYTVALGEEAVLPRETLKLAAAVAAAQDTGFGLNTITLSKPMDVAAKFLKVSDAVTFGMTTLTPEFSVTLYRFADAAGQDRTDYRQSLTAEFAPGGTARFVALLHATESEYRSAAFNARSYTALGGIADEATGIWNIRVLGGAALRCPVTGGAVTAPVLEASVSWMPDDLDSLQLDAAREVDDPDQESAAGYMLTEVGISIAHEYLRNVVLTAAFKFSHAAYFNAPLLESLYSANAAIAWHLNRAMAIHASYEFNDRQANFLNAANQHRFILGVTWSP